MREISNRANQTGTTRSLILTGVSALKRLNDKQVVEMRKKREDGVMIKDLMKEYGLSKSSVYRLMGTS